MSRNKASIEAVVARQVEYTKSRSLLAKEQNKVINVVNALDAVAKNGKINLIYVKFLYFLLTHQKNPGRFSFML
jgi:polyphosphate kinase 2 (PPK2 family)